MHVCTYILYAYINIACIHKHIHLYIQTRTHVHSHTRTHTHTRKHIYIYVHMRCEYVMYMHSHKITLSICGRLRIFSSTLSIDNVVCVRTLVWRVGGRVSSDCVKEDENDGSDGRSRCGLVEVGEDHGNEKEADLVYRFWHFLNRFCLQIRFWYSPQTKGCQH